MVQLDADNPYDDNEIYIRFGEPPPTTQYTAAGKVADWPDQYAEVPSTQAGTYYVLVRCTYDSGGSSDDYAFRAHRTRRADADVGGRDDGDAGQGVRVRLYRVQVAAGQRLIVQLDADNPYDDNELYSLRGLAHDDAVRRGGQGGGSADQYAEGAVDPGRHVLRAGPLYLRLRWQQRRLRNSRRHGRDVPTLTLGAATTGTLARGTSWTCIGWRVQAGQRLIVPLDADTRHDNELYVRYGALPTKTVYDAAGNASEPFRSVSPKCRRPRPGPTTCWSAVPMTSVRQRRLRHSRGHRTRRCRR